MLEYDNIDISEEVNINKTNLSKECNIVTIDILKILVLSMKSIFAMVVTIVTLSQKSMSFDNVVIVYVEGNAYRINFWYMGKDDANNVMNGSDLVDKRGVL